MSKKKTNKPATNAQQQAVQNVQKEQKKKLSKKEKKAIAEQRSKELNQKKTRNYGIGFVFSLIAVAVRFCISRKWELHCGHTHRWAAMH